MVTKLINLFIACSGVSALMLFAGGIASWMIYQDGAIFWPLLGVCLGVLGGITGYLIQFIVSD